MSYLIQNGIFLEGKIEEIINLLQFIEGPYLPKGQTKPIDFRKIIPMPKNLELGSNPSQEQISIHEKWCYENWGCIWDVKNSTRYGIEKIHFQTINGSGLRVIKELSKLSPTMKTYFAARYDYREYCCSLLNGTVLKANWAIDDEDEYALEKFFNINLSVEAAYDAAFDSLVFDKFCTPSKFEMENPPEDCLNEGANIEEEDEPDEPNKSSDKNEEIHKLINRGKCFK